MMTQFKKIVNLFTVTALDDIVAKQFKRKSLTFCAPEARVIKVDIFKNKWTAGC